MKGLAKHLPDEFLGFVHPDSRKNEADEFDTVPIRPTTFRPAWNALE